MSIIQNEHVLRSDVVDDGLRAFTFKSNARCRNNVLDLLDVFAGPAVTGYMFMNINMRWAEHFRAQIERDGHKVTATAIILKAIAIAQRNHPDSRTQFLPSCRTVTYNEVVAGFTVEREIDGQPIVFFGEIEKADVKPVSEIAAELSQYSHGDIGEVEKLREQVQFSRFPWIVRRFIFVLASWFPALRLVCMGSTFGLSSLGALGIKSVCGPSVCTSVFGVGAIEPNVVARDGEVVIEPVMSLSLSFDQRAMDYGQAARFFLEVKELLEGGMASFEICNVK